MDRLAGPLRGPRAHCPETLIFDHARSPRRGTRPGPGGVARGGGGRAFLHPDRRPRQPVEQLVDGLHLALGEGAEADGCGLGRVVAHHDEDVVGAEHDVHRIRLHHLSRELRRAEAVDIRLIVENHVRADVLARALEHLAHVADMVDHEASVDDRVLEPECHVVEALVGVIGNDIGGQCRRGAQHERCHPFHHLSPPFRLPSPASVVTVASGLAGYAGGGYHANE